MSSLSYLLHETISHCLVSFDFDFVVVKVLFDLI